MQPDLILVPFAQDAPAVNVDAIPVNLSPSDPPQAASYSQGFPAVTMTPLAAGGIPPRGQSFNGIFNDITKHLVYIGGGGQYKWSSAYVAATGGYSIGEVVQADDGLNSYVSLVDSNTDNFNTTPDSIGPRWGLYAGRNTQAQATETVSGLAEIATQAEVTAGADDARIVTPLKLRSAQATQAEAEAGTANNKIMTPLRVYQAISAFGDTLNTVRIDVASGADVNLTTAAPNTRHINITGGGTINGFTVAAGKCYFARFNATGVLTNSANLVTQSGANITTAQGDTCIIRATAANIVEVLCYSRASTGTWQNMLALRAPATNYQNPYSFDIEIAVVSGDSAGNSAGPAVTINGNAIYSVLAAASSGAMPRVGVTITVPAFATYRIDLDGADTLRTWWEKRP